VGLVLSGGGARGFGHVGATRALEEAGIAVDLVGASSMGAIVGGVYAFEANYEEMCQMASTLGTNNMIFDRTLPFVALNRSRNVTRVLQDLYAGKYIEDAWRPFFCTASSLTRARLMIIEEGDLALGVRVSSAIPGVFTPLVRGDDMIVDGGLMNNFPVDIMREKMASGTVIGVHVGPAIEKTGRYDLGTDVSGWDVLWRRVNPFTQRRRLPSVIGTLMRSLEINSLDQIRNARTMADFIIELDLSDFNSLNFDKHVEIIEAGYETARQRIEEWLQQNHIANLG
jgi:NTE family protein